ncbi:MAG: replicative DNA helicase [Bacilli bacterium]
MAEILPHNYEAEANILGSMLLDKSAMNKALEELNFDMFYSNQNSKIFEVMSSLASRNVPLDTTTIISELESKKILGEVGGVEYLTNVVTSVPSAINISAYIKIVRDKAILRSLIERATNIVNLSTDEQNDIDDIIEEAERTISDVSRNRKISDIKTMKEILASAHSRIEYLSRLEGDLIGIDTGYEGINHITSGFQGGQFIVIAARPAMGKTAMAINLAINAGKTTEKAVVIFNLEMSAESLAFRMISSVGEINSKKIITGNLESSDWTKLGEAMAELAETNIYVDDTAGSTIGEIKNKCRKLAMSESGLGLVIIDYLQLLSDSKSKYSNNRQQEVSDISRNLKLLALELNVPIIALSQLSRGVEIRDDKRPMLSDLRESGAIEQDADIVSFLYRDDYYNKTERKDGISESEFIIAKNRSGETDTVKLVFNKPYTLFSDISDKNGEEYE